MSGVHADPKEIRRFQSDMNRFNGELDVITKKLKSHLRTLGDTWRDDEYRKFEAMIDDVLRSFNRYLVQSNSYVNHLAKKAADLEKYQGS
jgi:uncharacterized protein YukE